MTAIGVMASAVVIASGTDVLAEPFNNFAAWTSGGSPTIQSGRTAVAAQLVVGDTLAYTIPSPSESNTVIVGFAFRISALSSEHDLLQLNSDAGATNHINLRVNSSGQLIVDRSSSVLLTTAAGVLAANTWTYVELQATLHDTTGAFDVHVNGTSVGSATNVDTKAGGTKTTVDTVKLTAAFVTHLYDDLYITTGTGAPFKGDQQIGPGFIAGVATKLWLDADDAATFTYSSGIVVSQWNDKSGNTRHTSQGTVANQPTRVTGAQNGRAAVRFDATDQLATAAVLSAATDNVTMIVACKRTGGGTQSVVVHNGVSGSNGYGLALRANSANVGLLRAAIAMESTATADPAAAGVLALQRSAGTWSLWLNGTATNLASTGSINTPGTSTLISSTVHSFVGDIYEVLAFDRVLSTTERQGNESYLKTKWGTP